MKIYKIAQNIPQTLYHISNHKFNKFNPNMTEQGIIWLAKNKEDLLQHQAGANININKPIYLYDCTINANKIVGWTEYDQYYIQQLKDMGYDSIDLDETIAVLNPNIITINNIQQVKS